MQKTILIINFVKNQETMKPAFIIVVFDALFFRMFNKKNQYVANSKLNNKVDINTMGFNTSMGFERRRLTT